MTNEVKNISVERSRREIDNLKLTALELIDMVKADIIEGRMNPDGVMVICIERPEDEDWKSDDYRCGLSRMEEIAMLRMAEERLLRRWMWCGVE